MRLIFPILGRIYQGRRDLQGPTPAPYDKLSLNDGLNLLTELCRKSSAYIVLDGVNESKEPVDVLAMVKMLAKRVPSARLMISSIEELSSPFTDTEVNIVPMDHGSVRKDIESYVNHSMETDPRLTRLPRDLKSLITATLQKHSNNMYLPRILAFSDQRAYTCAGFDGCNVS